MNAEMLSRFVPLLFGLLIFVAFELAIFISGLLLLLSRSIGSPQKLESKESSHIPDGEPVHTDTPRIEVVMIAPDLIHAIESIAGIQGRSDPVSPGPVEPSKLNQEERSGRDKDKNIVGREADAPPVVQSQKIFRELPLVLVSRAGNREQKITIGHLQTAEGSTEQLYNLAIDALLPRALVLEIANRTGVLQNLKAEFRKRENYEDPLRFALYLEVIKLNSPVLRDPESREIEFSIDFVPFLAGQQVPLLKVDDRKRPLIVSIGDVPVAKGGRSE